MEASDVTATAKQATIDDYAIARKWRVRYDMYLLREQRSAIPYSVSVLRIRMDFVLVRSTENGERRRRLGSVLHNYGKIVGGARCLTVRGSIPTMVGLRSKKNGTDGAVVNA
jgi:hypothetical protein